MAKEIDSKKMDKLVSFVKKQGFGNYSETDCVNETGIERGQIARYLYPAELKAFPNLKVPATGKGVVKARKDGMRIPRIAVFAGISESKVKDLYKAETGQDITSAYTGRGRKFDGMTTSGSTSGRRTSGGSDSKSKSKTKTATSGRRTSAAKKTSSAASPGRRPGRRTTRAAAASDPS